MKETGKDIFILIIVFILLGGIWFFIFRPNSNNTSKLSDTISSNIQRETNQQQILDINLASSYIPSLQEDISKTMQDYLQNDCKKTMPACGEDILFFKTDNQGNFNPTGSNNIIIFNPSSTKLDFKVNLGLSHNIYEKDSLNNYKKGYTAKNFSQLISEDNAKLDGKFPVAAINADYIDGEGNPQGLNVSRGVEYSGDFAQTRSSFAISGGNFTDRKGTIQVGKRKNEIDQFNAVGGNGRFYNNGNFIDICEALGEYACREARQRSMGVITSSGNVIFIVNTLNNNKGLIPSDFDDLILGLSKNLNLGSPLEAILFDGGFSPSMYWDGEVKNFSPGPIGSAFLIYYKD